MGENFSAEPGIASNANLAKEILNINNRIDDILAFQKRQDPWYRDTSVMISAAAFFVSIVASGITAYRTWRQDINSRKDALQSIIQQYYSSSISNLPFQYALKKDYIASQTLTQSNPSILGPLNAGVVGSADTDLVNSTTTLVAANINAKNAMLAKKSLELANELGNNASAIDLDQVGYMLGASYLFDKSEEIYQTAISRSNNSFEYMTAERGLAQTRYFEGDKDGASAAIKDSLKGFTKYDEHPSSDFVNYTNYQTYLFWMNFVGLSDCKLLKDNLDNATRYAGLLSTTLSLSNGVQAQITYWKSVSDKCGT